ncbi:MAG TPA: CRISPR-associated endonuclease Cas1 [Phycisphaerales bacterium]|nr:CRISPR-associated endonuclease Cas1 [Phycisphaerales bacterium]HMP36009.1 CRISPR-associated endonuclease Cas1 [Phycisphaerales bacterium]
MDESLWPARGVAEFAYCPRLFYYMTVEGIFAPSADTELGKRVHRRVDQPSLAPEECDDSGASAEADRPRAVRSFVLTSERLGLTATLDIAEIEGIRAIPVEYRKGRPSRAAPARDSGDEMMEPLLPLEAPTAWPTDRVQVGLQAILLEEAGYAVHEARIYYAAEKCTVVLRVDEALRQEALCALEAARRAASGPRPQPLVNDPRCPRCSLQPICLPDEINHQRLVPLTIDSPTDDLPAERGGAGGRDGPAGASALDDRPAPRRLWPPRDDGVHLVAQREGVKVGVRGESLRLTDREGALVRDVPLAGLESLAVLGSVQVSTQALTVLAQHSVPVAFLSAAGRLVAMMDPLGPTSARVRTAQVRRLDESETALRLARAVVTAKIANQRTLLMRNHVDCPSLAADDLAAALDGARRASTIDALRGHEGNAAAIYFRHFAGMFKEGVAEIGRMFDANGRRRRPPPDPVNAVLSFAYSMLTNECVVACRLASLEPTIGALHSTRPGRPALALDLMEPFRPLIADSVAISAFNRGELSEGHFLRTAAGCALTDAGRRGFFSAYGRRMDTEVSHPVFEYRLSYRRMLMLHARLVAAWLAEEIPTLEFLTTR